VKGSTTKKLSVMSRFVLGVILLIKFTLMSADPVIDITAIAGGSVSLRCDISTSNPPSVSWSDLVYNSDHNPQKIFLSENNVNRTIDVRHPNRNNYRVEEDYSLVINNCRLEEDPGQYVCQSRVDGKVLQLTYMLTVIELPQCRGMTDLSEGERTVLDCQAAFSGHTHPVVRWTAMDHNGHREMNITSVDRFEVRLSRHIATVTATPRDNGRRYTCHVTLGSTTFDCSLLLNVTYEVHNVTFLPVNSTSYFSGEEIRCVADGNPMPSVKIYFSGNTSVKIVQKSGLGWSSFVVPSSWIGSEKTVACVASNVIDGQSVEVNTSSTFTVSKRDTTTLSAKEAAALLATAHMGAIIAAVVISSLIIIIIIIAVICMRQKKKNKQLPQSKTGERLLSHSESNTSGLHHREAKL